MVVLRCLRFHYLVQLIIPSLSLMNPFAVFRNRVLEWRFDCGFSRDIILCFAFEWRHSGVVTTCNPRNFWLDAIILDRWLLGQESVGQVASLLHFLGLEDLVRWKLLKTACFWVNRVIVDDIVGIVGLRDEALLIRMDPVWDRYPRRIVVRVNILSHFLHSAFQKITFKKLLVDVLLLLLLAFCVESCAWWPLYRGCRVKKWIFRELLEGLRLGFLRHDPGCFWEERVPDCPLRIDGGLLLVNMNKGFEFLLILKYRIYLFVLDFSWEVEIILEFALSILVDELLKGSQGDMILFFWADRDEALIGDDYMVWQILRIPKRRREVSVLRGFWQWGKNVLVLHYCFNLHGEIYIIDQ